MKTKILVAALLAIMSVTQTLAQGGSIGFFANVSEYDGDLRGNKHQFYSFDRAQFGGAISLQQYLNRSFNLMQTASYSHLQYKTDGELLGVNASFVTLNLNLKYKLNNGYIFKEDAAIAPFITAGLGGTYITSNQFSNSSSATITNGLIKPNFNAGVGILFQLNDRVGIEFSNTVQMPIYDGWDGVTAGDNDLYLQHSLGLVFNLKKPKDTDGDGILDKKDNCPNTPSGVAVNSDGCPADRDNDGIADYLDKCPETPGASELNGCPDRDKDGITDLDDKCPDVSGPARFNGCPDTDGDGVQDSEDACPNVRGTDAFKGCPDSDGDGVEDSLDKCAGTMPGTKVNASGCDADTDGDGVLDRDDSCPNLAGVATNKGCPEVKPEVKQLFQRALQGIQFEPGRAVIKATSNPILDAITKVMVDNPSYKLAISGYTDDSGDDASNMTLSKNRADAVANYLIGKGVNPMRVSAKGFGETTRSTTT
jgi:outer membrane protein OmpA-like peptidoglycan-associated protein/outer membrane protein W